MKHLLVFVIALLSLPIATVRAQDSPGPPRLVVERAERPVILKRAEIALSIVGPLASATETLTFFNPNGRTLEGEALLPLPEGATLSGYALDVNGELVDAVPVERERARVVYETEMRKGVDPGLAEKADGNVFRLRLYPIPAGGTRTVRVHFHLATTTRGADRTATLPLRWGVVAQTVALRVDAPGASARLGTVAIPEGGITLSGERLDSDLVVRAPAPSAPSVHVERFGDESFFLIESHEVAPPFDHAPVPGEFTVLWDASLSRRSADLGRERELLRLLLARLDAARVGVRVLRDTLGPVKTFSIENGDGSALLNYLDAVPLDGGTDLGALNALPKLEKGGFYLLFSDGVSTLGRAQVAAAGSPLWAVTSGPEASYPYLRALAESSGGAMLNLSEMSVASALWHVGQPAFGLQRVTEMGDDRGAVDIHFRRDRSLIAGKLVGDPAQLTLHYGFPGQEPLLRRNVVVNMPEKRAKAGGAIARWWAAQEAERLSIDPETNREALVKLGQNYGIVTEGTSLLVLETLEQHIEHGVAPTRTRPALYDAYLAHEKKAALTQKKKDDEQLKKVVAKWNATLAWWDKTFTYPKNFRYKAEEKQKNGGPPRQVSRDRSSSVPRPMAFRTAVGESEFAKKDGGDDAGFGAQASVTIKPWSPDVPYVKAMKAAGAARAYSVYLAERKTWGATPGFYIDCAETLFQLGRRAEGRGVLLGLADLGAGDPALLRILARRLLSLGESGLAVALFEKVLLLRPEEPHSLRDLALAHEAAGEPLKALIRLDELIRGRWQRGDTDFDDIEIIALIEANGILSRLGRTKIDNPLDPRLIRPLAADLRIVMSWDTDLTDMDLHVIEPSGEECDYNHNRTVIGGHLSDDCTRGYGPEEYFVKRAMPGRYTIKANYFGSQSQNVLGATTVQATVITNFGRPTEKRSYLTLRLTERKESVLIGEALIR